MRTELESQVLNRTHIQTNKTQYMRGVTLQSLSYHLTTLLQSYYCSWCLENNFMIDENSCYLLLSFAVYHYKGVYWNH